MPHPSAHYLLISSTPPAEAPVEPEVPALPADDGPILDDAVARLAATGAFGPDDGSARVGWGHSLEVLFPELDGSAAAIEYLGSTETTLADVSFQVREGRYALTLAVVEEDPRARQVALAGLAGVARNALSGVRLGGVCQPFFCRLREDATAAAGHPEGRRRLAGTFRYPVEDDDSRDESGDD